MEYFHQKSDQRVVADTCAESNADGGDDENGTKRQITENDFNAVRPKVRNGTTPSKAQKPLAESPRKTLTTKNR